MLNQRFSGSGLFLLSLLLAAAPVSLRAGDVRWDVSGLGFSDEGVLSGTFVYDADTGVMRTWNLSTAGGDPMNFPDFTYTPANSSFSVINNALVFSGPLFPAINPFSNGFRQLRLGPFNTPLDDSGGGRDVLSDPFGNQECYNCFPQRTLAGSLFGTPLPDLTISKSHAGNFTAGQLAATYTIMVTNSGIAPTSGTVTVVDTLPPSMGTGTLSGAGWTCNTSTVTCTRTDSLPAGMSYPPISLTVIVNATAPPMVTNSVTVSGGGEANTSDDTATDPTIILEPQLGISLTPGGPFRPGDTGDTISIVVANSGTGASTGPVLVTNSLPPNGLTATALTGTGWSCTTATCMRSDGLGPGLSYPPITLTVNVASNAPPSLTDSATVTAPGQTATGATTINLSFPPLSCQANSSLAVLRQESGADAGGNIVLICTGGSPTPEGMPLPIVQFTLTFTPGNTVGGRILTGSTPPIRGEALALVDEPGAPIEEGATPQLVCADPAQPCSILATGSGQGDYNGSVGRPNVFQSNAVTASSQQFNIPFDPPGQGSRIVRFTNLRIDSRAVPPSGSPSMPASISATVAATSSQQIMITNPTQVIGFISNGANVSVSGGTGTPNRVSQFSVVFQEAIGTGFRTRSTADFAGNDVSPPPVDQNVPGTIYNSETAFHSSAFPVLTGQGDLTQAGLADSGTRLIVKVAGVPAGVQMMVPAAVNSGTSANPSIGVVRLITADTNGVGPFMPNGTVFSPTPMSVDSSGNAYAVYEVLSTDPQSFEAVTIPVTPVYPPNSTLMWPSAQVSAGLASLDSTSGPSLTSPVPRFRAPANFTINATLPPPMITTTVLPGATAGQAYTFSFGATGGVPPYIWSATGLPSFLGISSAGVLSGTFPNGSLPGYSLNVTANDSAGGIASTPVTITVTLPPPLTITSTSLPPGTPGSAYSFQFVANGGNTPYTWSADGLPSFLTFSGSGSLNGTIPANPLASYSFFITVRDANSSATFVPLTLTINRPPLTVNVSQISGVSVDVHFSTMLTSNGVQPITWTGSGLPSWLTLQTDGILEGTPPTGANQPQALAQRARAASTSSYSFTVTATDATGNSGSSNTTLTVAPPPLVITTTSPLAGGVEGKAYSTQLAASGGTPPYSWTATGLSSGLTLSSAGVVSGTPVSGSAGAVAFQTTVSDANGTTQSSGFTIPVASGSNHLTITSPALLPDAGAGLRYNITLTASGGTPPYVWSETSVGLGLTLSSSGNVNGTGRTPAKLGFTGQVTDSSGATVSQAFALNVIPKFGITTSSPVASGIVGVPYFQLFGAIGGTQPYQWSISGALPAGLGFTPDGVISGVPNATGSFTVNVTARDSASNVATAPFLISVQSPAAVDLILSAGSLSFSTQTGGAPPPLQSFGVNATGPASVQFSASTSANSWLRLGSSSGPTPGSVSVFADQTGLVPGLYQATIMVTSPNTSPKSVPVSLTVVAGSASISVSPSSLQLFAPAAASAPVTSAIQLTSTSAAAAAFQANVVDLPFLTVSPQQGSVAQNSPVVLNLSADAHGLAVGFYRGRVEIVSSGAVATAYVTVQVGAAGRLILSSQGTTLDAQVGTAIAGPAAQSFTVLGADATPLHFTASIVGSAPFLTLESMGGVASLAQPASVPFTVSSTGLPPGAYYGRIRITSPDAVNSPQEFLVVLNVRATGVTPDLNAFPSGLAFLPGGASQTVQAYTDSGPLLNLQVAVTTQSGGNWLSAQASKSTISATSPAQVVVSANAAGLAPGIYRGFVALAPASAQVRTVGVTLVVPGKGPVAHPGEGERPAAVGACAPSQLVLSQTGLTGNFTTAAAWPKLISAQLTDDCGTAIPTAQVITSFSNGDPPLRLDLSDPTVGAYSTTWAPSSAASPVAVTLAASASAFAPVSLTVSGGVSPNMVPIVSQGAVLHLLNPKPSGLLAPGTIVQIFGSGLAASPATPPSLPPTTINGTTVLLGGTAVPLYYVSPTQVNAELPFELLAGHEYQLLVNANGGYTIPQPLQFAPVAPGVASFPDGHVIAQHGDYSLVSSTSPAKPGEALVIYLAGMGATTVPVATGDPAPSGPLANASTAATVLVDGQPANVLFAGLTPQAVGLYQINFVVPAGIHSGDVALEVSQGSVSANKTMLQTAGTP
jgi:uncharacterized protein (TIGR03437 family)